MSDDLFTIHPIGTVYSPVLSRTDENWGSIEAEIHVKPDFAPALQGLEDFSHAIILTWLHQATFDLQRDLIRHPRGRKDLPKVGIFAQRAKNRPNPIGVSVVEILNCDTNILRVKRLDAIHGTPVIDIKPYYATYDRIESPVAPLWVNDVMTDYF
ncbi:MAG: tRNA (N6-threonylcarbamoyladenosine(37)-N6)-methyltransferase TrmO [Betaproteobacteria bacterium]|jgi:tRNA-Thr(GGU) m(6)t(6)A37 methyltransferase TsaA|nr:tRNA (N6-threonylcarbamoyladenosine(37)-N6)-methyltransferase TrmO [Betaproteobacteria bacterium]